MLNTMNEFKSDHYKELKDLIYGEMQTPLEYHAVLTHLLHAVGYAYEDSGDKYYENVMKVCASILRGDTP